MCIRDRVWDLPDGIAKGELFHRLEVILTEIDKDAAIAEIVEAIAALPAPGELTLAHRGAVADVRYLLKAARDHYGVTDDDINNLDILEQAEVTLAALEKANIAVDIAEKTRHPMIVDYARGLVAVSYTHLFIMTDLLLY